MEQRLVTHHNAAATAKTEFAGREVDDVKEVGDHTGNFPNGLILHALLTGFDEVQVVLQQGSIQHGHDAVFTGNLGGSLHVLVGDGLTADEVCACLQAHVGNILRTLLLDAGLNLIQVDIALEGKGALGDKALIPDQLLHLAAQAGNMRLGGGEVVVHDHAAAGLNKVLGNDMLAGSALVGGQEELHAEQLRQLLVHSVEGLAAGVGIVGAEHGGLHIVAHGIHTGIGEHIHKNIAVVKQKCIEARLLQLGQALTGRQQRKLLHDLHLVHLHRHRGSVVKFDLRHGIFLRKWLFFL